MVFEASPKLLDGSQPATFDQLFERFVELGIETATTHHPAVYTVEQAKKLRGAIEGCHSKNLFVRNKKGRMWLIVCLEDRRINLKLLGRHVGAGSFSFASPERLMKYLGLTPGAVTPFAVINDHGGHVQVVLDQEILLREPLNFHPLVNSMTTSISAADFLAYLEAEEHPPIMVDFSEIESVLVNRPTSNG